MWLFSFKQRSLPSLWYISIQVMTFFALSHSRFATLLLLLVFLSLFYHPGNWNARSKEFAVFWQIKRPRDFRLKKYLSTPCLGRQMWFTCLRKCKQRIWAFFPFELFVFPFNLVADKFCDSKWLGVKTIKFPSHDTRQCNILTCLCMHKCFNFVFQRKIASAQVFEWIMWQDV